MRRWLGIAFGVATHVLFAVTVWRLYWFLYGRPAPEHPQALWIDAALAIQFAVPHSLLLWPPVRKRLGRWIQSEFYGCFYCVATCLSLWVLFDGWRSSPGLWWECGPWAAWLVRGGFLASWIGLFYSLHLTGLGYQTGLTPWLHWLRGEKLPRRDFVPRGAYRWFRHPVYLSFLGLIWFTPVMSSDHGVLTAVWTVYIFLGSYLKDERLEHYLGDSYGEYRRSVPGYPFLPTPRRGSWQAHPSRPV
ncbi:MAG: NnrU family protein [Pirellulales bacterium]